ncbi:MAG: glycerol-3-phosphate 1-O-acyltransferase PlsY [Bryobacteraceae bacterium]
MTASLTAVAAISYFLGGLPFGYWFVRLALGKDIRTMGSGNIGATNVHRSAGTKAGIVVLLLDIAKGLLAVWIGSLLTGGLPLGLAVAVVAVMLGHCYPVLLKFKGGKAVACFVGAFLYIAPLPLLAVIPVFVITVWWSRHISLGSIIGAIFFPFFVWLIQNPPLPILMASVIAAVLIVYRHKSNIARLHQGTESVFSFKGSNR